MINDMSNEVKGGFIVGMISAVLLMVGTYILISLVVSLIRKYKDIKSKTIIFTPEDIEVLEEALSCSELSFRDLLTENPESCNEDEVHREIAKIRKLSTEFIGTLQDSSSVIIEVFK